MYNLNYTYLTDLEVDTRLTFSDISDDLLLLDHAGTLVKATAKTTISSWQDYFWNCDNVTKQTLDVIFTDLSVSHDASDNLSPNEMVTYGELQNFFNTMDATSSWCKTSTTGYTFDGLIRELSSAINTLHRRMLVNTNTVPTGSIVIADTNPKYTCGFGEWNEMNASYIAEKIAGISDVSIGFNNGKAGGQNVGSNRSRVVVTPSTNGKIPSHTHKLVFEPTSGSGSGSVGPEETTETFEVLTSTKPGLNKGGDYYSGYRNPSTSDYNCAASCHNGDSSARKGGGDAQPSFSVGYAKKDANLSSINVAPTTFPINGKLWERRS